MHITRLVTTLCCLAVPFAASCSSPSNSGAGAAVEPSSAGMSSSARGGDTNVSGVSGAAATAGGGSDGSLSNNGGSAGTPDSGAGTGGTSLADGGAPASAGAGSGEIGGASGALGSAGSATAGAGGSAPVAPPVRDTKSTLAIASGGAGYKVDGNVIYGPLSTQRLDVLYPTNAGPNGTQTLPGVIMFHGGGWIEDHKANIQSFVTAFLAHGFVVCTVEYRLADGTATGAIAPAAVEDALLAAQWFWQHLDYYHVDKTKYISTGGSAGGHLALMVGMATSAAEAGPVNPTDFKIAAIVNGYGPTDVTDLLKRGTSWAVQWLPANTPDRAGIAARMSPINYVRADIPPLITVQGSDDTTVPVVQNQDLVAALQAAGADASIHLVAGAGHGFATPAGAWADAQTAMFGFLVQHGIGK
jgi:acetyl esterase/lipase